MAGHRTIEDYWDAQRTGHRDAVHAKVYRRLVRETRATSPAIACAVMREATIARGWRTPSVTTASRILADIGHPVLVAAREGSRAAELDAIPTLESHSGAQTLTADVEVTLSSADATSEPAAGVCCGRNPWALRLPLAKRSRVVR